MEEKELISIQEYLERLQAKPSPPAAPQQPESSPQPYPVEVAPGIVQTDADTIEVLPDEEPPEEPRPPADTFDPNIYRRFCDKYPGCFSCTEYLRDRIFFCKIYNFVMYGSPIIPVSREQIERVRSELARELENVNPRGKSYLKMRHQNSSKL